jgi:tetratricopeptide (TPR) repeat protein
MENNNCIQGLYSYQNANLSDEEVIKHFIVRKNEYELIISEIRRDNMSGSIQHYLLIGRQGSGKSTLLSRIKAEINLDEKLNKKLIVVYLSEEQAGVYRLHDLWDLILRDLNARNITTDHPQWSVVEEDTASYSRSLYLSIQKALKSKNRKLVLLLDNIDRIFDNIGDDAHLLRELLTNYKDLRIIGGSTRMSEHYWKYDKPFYQFFRIIRLDSLTSQEVRTLLDYWSRCLNLPAITQFIEKNPGKIETIRVLTDGMPRTLQHFIEILIDRTHQNGFEYLRLILDRASPLYRDRLNYFPPAQRKVVLELSNFWDAVRVSQLTEACKMPGKLVSAQLSQLVKAEVVEKISGPRRENLYRIAERFFNLWLLMTQGGPREKRQVRYLTVFLESWYDQAELLSICEEHLVNLDAGKLKPSYAAMMSTALAHSKYITFLERDSLIEKTISLKDSVKEYIDFLPPASEVIFKEMWKKFHEGDFASARSIINNLEQEDSVKFLILGFISTAEKDYSIAEKYYLLAIDKGNVYAFNHLAILYKNTGKINEAEKYYLLAIDKGHVDALNNLAILYKNMGRKDDAEKYYLLAIEKGNIGALNNLANLYSDLGRNDEAEKYYLVAIEKGIVDALYDLALHYKDMSRYDEAEKYFLLAIEKGNVDALYNVTVLYYVLNKNKSEALDLIGKYLLKSNDFQAKAFQLVLFLWSGNIPLFLEKFPPLLSDLILNNEIKWLKGLFEDCLIHHQSAYLWQWFTHPEFGEKLKEMIKPVYFVVASLMEGQEEETLKPGPELTEAISGIKDYIAARQKFYYG